MGYSCVPTGKCLSLLVSFLMFIPSLAEAVICMPSRSDTETPGEYIKAFASALSYLKAGQEELLSGMKDSSDAFAVMSGFSKSKENFDCAIEHIKPFEKAKTKTMAQAAQGFISAVQSIAASNVKMESEVKDLLDGKVSSDGAGTRAAKHAQTASKLNEDWKMILLVATLSSHIIVDETKQGHFRISKSERDEALKTLKDAFSKSVKAKDRRPLVVAADLLITFLGGKWKLAPEAANAEI